MYDLIIVGGGPAGVAAAVYAARKRLKTLLVTTEFGGQSTVSSEIQNWIGTTAISGEQLAKDLHNHAKAYADDILEIKEGEYAKSVTKEADKITLTTDEGTYSAKTLLIATGSHRRKLEVPGADKFEHKGVTYCASCDGPLFSDMDVAVLGGGNAGFETVAQLVAYCKSVTLINRSNHYRADPITVEKILANPKVTAINNSDIIEVKGDAMVSSVIYKNKTTGETKELPVQGVFIEIGQIPNTEYAKGVVEMTDYGQVKIDPRTQKTSTPGIWAAGDCTDVLYHQNNIAAGDAVRALEDIYQSIHSR
ncbi:MAG: FAD-dependent oxidoreductase [Patescibacteria group bacterium]